MQTRSVCWLVIAIAAGCGSSNTGGAGRPSPDAPPPPPIDGGVPPDAAPAARCDPTKPFGTPALVPSVSSNKRDQGAILIDDLTMLLGSDRATPTMIYKATRATPTGPFQTPAALTALNGNARNPSPASSPTLTDDGLTLYYTLVNTQGTGDIMVSQRATTADDFPTGTPVVGVNTAADEEDPYITPDGAALYFGSSTGGVQLDMYVALRKADGTFGTPRPLTAFNTAQPDSHPHLTHDGLTLYWSSTRTDGGAQGGTDIWMATRPSITGAFASPTRVPELSSATNESLSWISADNCEAYLQSDRPGGLGAQDIYVARRPL